ncbi:MAG: hypothetical protein MUF25_23630, partial [Pirellulaceae bacterium]|nr:hypothetical protein [Pirellulaceae bacterium]
MRMFFHSWCFAASLVLGSATTSRAGEPVPLFDGKSLAGWDVLWRYVSEVLTVQTAAVPYPENQSIDGLLSRLVIPVEATTWYTTIPFPRWTLLAMYLLALAIFAVTVRGLWGRWRADVSRRQFEFGYGATLVVVVLLWPTSWIHYETLLLLPFTVLALDQLDSRPRPWGVLGLLAVSYLAVAIGNE